MNAWVLLLLGIIFEVAGTSCIKMSNGFTNAVPSLLAFILFSLALALITLSAKTLDISMVYAIWSGVGIVLITLMGVICFSEKITIEKAFYIALILAGVMGLHQATMNNTSTESEHVSSSE